MALRKKTTVKKKKVIKKKSGTARSSSNKKNKAIKSAASFKLEPILVINNARALSQELNRFIENSDEINIDASAVEMIDTAVLQVLLAIANKARSEKREIHWIAPSDIFLSNISLLGISRQIGIS
jgi:anti-anti-sigma regulatory factor